MNLNFDFKNELKFLEFFYFVRIFLFALQIFPFNSQVGFRIYFQKVIRQPRPQPSQKRLMSQLKN